MGGRSSVCWGAGGRPVWVLVVDQTLESGLEAAEVPGHVRSQSALEQGSNPSLTPLPQWPNVLFLCSSWWRQAEKAGTRWVSLSMWPGETVRKWGYSDNGGKYTLSLKTGPHIYFLNFRSDSPFSPLWIMNKLLLIAQSERADKRIERLDSKCWVTMMVIRRWTRRILSFSVRGRTMDKDTFQTTDCGTVFH